MREARCCEATHFRFYRVAFYIQNHTPTNSKEKEPSPQPHKKNTAYPQRRRISTPDIEKPAKTPEASATKSTKSHVRPL